MGFCDGAKKIFQELGLDSLRMTAQDDFTSKKPGPFQKNYENPKKLLEI